MNLLDPEELEQLLPAETQSYPGPIPTQSVSSDEFMPYPQTAAQRRVEARIKDMGGEKVCVHKGLSPPSVEKQFPHLLAYSNVDDAGRAAKDWPQRNFVIYHSAYRFAGYKYERRSALAGDRVAARRREYEEAGPARSNLRYGYVVRAGA